jgi:hypothetical protein
MIMLRPRPGSFFLTFLILIGAAVLTATLSL